MNISEKIISLRKASGLSQEALADRLGISRQAVSKWETGESVPDTDKIVQLAQLFGTTTDYLLIDEELPSASPANSAESVRTTGSGLLNFVKKKGWIGGLIISGYALAGFGVSMLARYMFKQTLTVPEEFLDPGESVPAMFRLPFIFTDVIGGVCLAAVIAGIVVAVVLRKRAQKD